MARRQPASAFVEGPDVRSLRAPKKGQGNERRDAESIVFWLHLCLVLGSRSPVMASPVFVVSLLIEVYVGSASCFAGAFARYGYSMRILLPRTRTGAIPESDPPAPPAWRLNEMVFWRLDLRAPKHQAALLEFLMHSPIPADVRHAHLHTSPKCTWASKGQRINRSLGRDLLPSVKEGRHVMTHDRTDND